MIPDPAPAGQMLADGQACGRACCRSAYPARDISVGRRQAERVLARPALARALLAESKAHGFDV
jgi:hypothetical protein